MQVAESAGEKEKKKENKQKEVKKKKKKKKKNRKWRQKSKKKKTTGKSAVGSRCQERKKNKVNVSNNDGLSVYDGDGELEAAGSRVMTPNIEVEMEKEF